MARAARERQRGTFPPTVVLFRVMLKTSEGRPQVGAEDNMLGARIGVDVKPDEAGRVHPAKGGMSVTPNDAKKLPRHLRPVSLGGNGRLPLFRMPADVLGNALRYRPDPRRPDAHGLVEPATAVPIAEYQGALAQTEPRWKEAP